MPHYYTLESAKGLLLVLIKEAGGNRALYTSRHWRPHKYVIVKGIEMLSCEISSFVNQKLLYH